MKKETQTRRDREKQSFQKSSASEVSKAKAKQRAGFDVSV